MKRKTLSLFLAFLLTVGTAGTPVRALDTAETTAATENTISPSETEEQTNDGNTGGASDPSKTSTVTTEPPQTESTVPPTTEATVPPTTETTVPPTTETTVPPTTEPTGPEQTDPTVSTDPTNPTDPTDSTIPTDPTKPSTPEEPQIPTALEIDTEHIYHGMDMAYEDGYSPRVSDGYAHIVLPLLSNGNINNERIKVSLNLGSSASSPFVITNYEKTFSLESVTPKNSMEAQEVFLVRFDIQLSSERINGVYPVTANISGYDASGKPIDCIYTIYVTITDGKSNKIPTISPEVPTAEPVVYISKSVIEPQKVMAGEEFTLTLTLKNSLTTKYVRNMRVKVDTGNLKINLLEDSNLFQIDRIRAGEEAELTLRFSSDASIPAGKYNLNFSFNYDSTKALNLSSNDSVIVDIQQPADMELVMPRFAESVTVGETVPLSLQVMNMGRDSMYNVRCVVSGFGFAPSNTGYIGTMDAGSSAVTKVELYIIALNASPGNENGSQYGGTTGTVTLIYEDDFGEEFQQEIQFDTEVKRPIVEVPQTQDTEEVEERASLAYWFAILILGGVAIAAFALGMVIKHQSRKHGRYL